MTIFITTYNDGSVGAVEDGSRDWYVNAYDGNAHFGWSGMLNESVYNYDESLDPVGQVLLLLEELDVIENWDDISIRDREE